MKVQVERCMGTAYYFRLTVPGIGRLYISNPENGWWQRHTATAALDLLERYGIKRRSVQFVHL